MKDLLENILGRKEDYYNKDYVNVIFPNEYKLIEKLSNSLSKTEFSLLHQMINEDDEGLYKLICHFKN